MSRMLLPSRPHHVSARRNWPSPARPASWWRPKRRGAERDDDGTPLDARFEGSDFGDVQDEARAVAGLDDVRAAQVALVDFLHAAAQAVDRAGKIECDPRGVRNAETRRGRGEGLLERELQQHGTTLLGNLEVFDAVRRGLALRRRSLRKDGGRRNSQGERRTQQRNHAFVIHFRASCCSCSSNVLMRSTQSPFMSSTSSFRVTSDSEIAVTSPKFWPM